MIPDRTSEFPTELRQLARDVRRMGDGYRADAETLALRREAIAERLLKLAREAEGRP